MRQGRSPESLLLETNNLSLKVNLHWGERLFVAQVENLLKQPVAPMHQWLYGKAVTHRKPKRPRLGAQFDPFRPLAEFLDYVFDEITFDQKRVESGFVVPSSGIRRSD